MEIRIPFLSLAIVFNSLTAMQENQSINFVKTYSYPKDQQAETNPQTYHNTKEESGISIHSGNFEPKNLCYYNYTINNTELTVTIFKQFHEQLFQFDIKYIKNIQPNTFPLLFEVCLSPHEKLVAYQVRFLDEKSDKIMIISILDTETQETKQIINPFGPLEVDAVRLAFSADGNYLVVTPTHPNAPIKILNVQTMNEIASFDPNLSCSWCSSSLNSDCTLLAAGSTDNTIKIYDITSQKEIIQLEGHSKTVSCVRFSPDKNLFASES